VTHGRERDHERPLTGRGPETFHMNMIFKAYKKIVFQSLRNFEINHAHTYCINDTQLCKISKFELVFFFTQYKSGSLCCCP
jgi:hypothetical protein